jgi:hydroxymethylpyrimidine/phosphomethylpyrimidine kinase
MRAAGTKRVLIQAAARESRPISKTFAALGCNGMAVIAALTAQNTQEVRAVHVPLASFDAAQIDAVFEDIDVAAVKIGMLASAAVAEAVADRL